MLPSLSRTCCEKKIRTVTTLAWLSKTIQQSLIAGPISERIAFLLKLSSETNVIQLTVVQLPSVIYILIIFDVKL